jgi:hypothetical protein
MRLRAALLALLLSASPPCAAYDLTSAPGVAPVVELELVVALCREQNLHFLRTLVHELFAAYNVTVTFYCKCGLHPSATACTQLENVGREAHTFLHHLVSRYDSLAPVTFFINGGMGAEAGATECVFLTAHNLAAVGTRAWFVDKNLRLEKPVARANDTQWGGSTAAFIARAREECTNGTACCKLCRVSWCCRLFGSGLCPLTEDRLFDEQASCKWGGKNAENYGGQFDRRLKPASPPAFAAWVDQRWGVSIHTFEQQQWSPASVFAVGREAVRAWPKTRLEGALAELAASGLNGGMVGHFYERTWRSLFSTVTPREEL